MKKYPLISYRTFFFLLPLIYFFFYGGYGLDDVDGGYAMSLSYRIIIGQVPYRDFIFVRPPLSLYLHALPMLFIPAAYQLIANRLIAYLTFALTTWISTEIISKHFNLDEYKLNKYLLSCITFVFSVHNFPPMAWYTTDGILLGVIGIYFLSVCKTNAGTWLGMLFLVASALTKQSFYPMPLAGLAYLYFTQPVKNLLKGFASLVVFAALIYLVASWSHLLKPFLQWTNGSTRLSDALDAGLWSYINKRIFKIPLVCIALFLVLKFGMKYFLKTNIENGWLIMAYLLTIFISVILRSRMNEPIHFQRLYPQIFFMATVAGVLFYFYKYGKHVGLLVLFLMLSLSWCSSISWGYQTPLLFSTPLVFGMIWFSKELLHFRHIRLLCYFFLGGGLLSFYFANGNAYYDGKRKDLVYNMEKVFPKLSCIKSDKETFVEYSELRNLAERYGNNFKTLPSIPLANYLTNTIPPIGVDWVLDREINNHIDEIIDELNKSNCYVFVEKNPVLKITSICRSSLTIYVMDHWKKISESTYFYVYEKP